MPISIFVLVHEKFTRRFEWKPLHQFRSHDLVFDYLKSLEVEAKINKIQFLPKGDENIRIISTNGNLASRFRYHRLYFNFYRMLYLLNMTVIHNR